MFYKKKASDSLDMPPIDFYWALYLNVCNIFEQELLFRISL